MYRNMLISVLCDCTTVKNVVTGNSSSKPDRTGRDGKFVKQSKMLNNSAYSRLGNNIQLFHTFLCNSQNYHPRGAVDDPMHCCPRPKAEGNSASGHPQHRGGDSFDCCTERYEIVVLLPNSEDTCYWKYFLKFE